jgi:hypothetical protein
MPPQGPGVVVRSESDFGRVGLDTAIAARYRLWITAADGHVLAAAELTRTFEQ